ncbi:MAG: hypothetical protein ACI4KF_05905 [Huintestinicola sp.]
MKKRFSAAIAAIMALTLSMGVYAADYNTDPGYDRPLIPSQPEKPSYSGSFNAASSPGSTESNSGPKGSSMENPTELISGRFAESAIESGDPIYASYKQAVVKSSIMGKLARTYGGVLNVITKRYSIDIKASSVTEAKDIDLGMTLTKNTKYGALFIKTAQEGSYGCTLNMRVAPKYFNQAKVDIKKAHLYYIVPEKNSLVDLGEIVLDDNANIVVTMSVGGKYVIM